MGGSIKQRFKEAMKGNNKLGLFGDAKEIDGALRISGPDARIFGFNPLRKILKPHGLSVDIKRDSEVVFVRNARKASAR